MTVEIPFYLAAVIAVIASLRVVTGTNAIHALLYLVVSLLAVAVCFYCIGAPFAAALEVVVYAGAILILFVFAVMMFDLQGDEEPIGFGQSQGNNWFSTWFGPSVLAGLLLFEMMYLILQYAEPDQTTMSVITAKQVGILLYGPYLLAVEIASFLLLAGLVAGFHLAKPETKGDHL